MAIGQNMQEQRKTSKSDLDSSFVVSKGAMEAIAYADLKRYVGYVGRVQHVEGNPPSWDYWWQQKSYSLDKLDPPILVRIRSSYHQPRILLERDPNYMRKTHGDSPFTWNTTPYPENKETGVLTTLWRIAILEQRTESAGYDNLHMPAFSYDRRVENGGRRLIVTGGNTPDWLHSFVPPPPLGVEPMLVVGHTGRIEVLLKCIRITPFDFTYSIHRVNDAERLHLGSRYNDLAVRPSLERPYFLERSSVSACDVRGQEIDLEVDFRLLGTDEVAFRDPAQGPRCRPVLVKNYRVSPDGRTLQSLPGDQNISFAGG